MIGRLSLLYDGLARALVGLSRRKRALIALLFLGAAPLALWFGVVAPQRTALSEARSELAEAAALRDWVAAQDAAMASLLPAAPANRTGAPAPIGVSGIEQSLVAADLRSDVARLAAQGDGSVVLGFDRVRFLALTEWLDAVAPDWGYRIAAFSFTRLDAPDTVAAEFTLTPEAAAPAR